MSDTRRFTKKYANQVMVQHLGEDVEFEIDRIGTKQYIVYVPKKPEGTGPMDGVTALRKEFRDYTFSLL